MSLKDFTFKVSKVPVEKLSLKQLKAELRYLRWHIGRYTRIVGGSVKIEGDVRTMVPGPLNPDDADRKYNLEQEIKRREDNNEK